MKSKPVDIITAVVTPFEKNQREIDLKSFRSIIKRLKTAGTQGVVVTGSTGEAATLSITEKQLLWSTALEFQSPSFQIWAGTGTNDTATTLSLSALAQDLGVDAILLACPYYNKPTAAGLEAHFGLIAKAVARTNVVLYEIPGRSGISIPVPSILSLAKRHKNIVGVKESSPDLSRITQLKLGSQHQLKVWSGDDPNFLPSLALGADGIISVASHCWPKEFCQLGRAWNTGAQFKARQIHEALFPRMQALFSVVNPIGVKAALSQMGLCSDSLRLPLLALEAPERRQLLSKVFSK